MKTQVKKQVERNAMSVQAIKAKRNKKNIKITIIP